MVFNRWIKPNCRGVWLSMLCSSTYSWARDLSHSCDNRYGITQPAIPGGLLCFQSVYPSSPRRIHPWYCRPRPSGTLRRRSEWAAQPWRLPCQPLCRASPEPGSPTTYPLLPDLPIHSWLLHRLCDPLPQSSHFSQQCSQAVQLGLLSAQYLVTFALSSRYSSFQ